MGTHLAQHFLKSGRFSHVHIADIRETPLKGLPNISSSLTDVRLPINLDLPKRPDWIFHLAAIHREPGHEAEEYFETNIKGAETVCDFAARVACPHIYFTSSIAVYGPCLTPTSEHSRLAPTTPYGSSKLKSEELLSQWRAGSANRRLLISRPGVIYGPGDPGNIMRMIKAIRKGYFAIPGSKNIHKSYAYIYGFIESVDFALDSRQQQITYNYVEHPTETVGEITRIIKNIFHSKAPILSIPAPFLVTAATFLQFFLRQKSPVHPVRVRKAATPTHIIPQVLLDMGFIFNFDFLSSIKHWQHVAPEDFEA